MAVDAETAGLDYLVGNEVVDEKDWDVTVPGDRGGRTIWGVAERWNKGDPIFSMTDPAEAKARARVIFATKYVAPLGLGWDYPRVTTKVADFAIVAGPGTSARMLQAALIGCGARTLKQDGRIGDKTRAAIAVEVVRNGDANILAHLCRWHELHFLDIARRNPSQRKFIRGWSERAMKLPEAA